METKICVKCNETLSTIEFYKNKRRIDGLETFCKNCNKKMRDHTENTEKIEKYKQQRREISAKRLIEYNKQYSIDNKEKNKEKKKEYNKLNKDMLSEKSRNYYLKNSIKIIERVKEYSTNNKEKIVEAGKLYRFKNKEEIKIRKRLYAKNNAESVANTHKKYYEANRKRLVILKSQYTKEHREQHNISSHIYRSKKKCLTSTLTILQWEQIKLKFNNTCCYCGKESKLVQEHFIPMSKGGEYTHNNIVPSCQYCNSSKHDKLFNVWYPKYKWHSSKREKIILKFLNYENNNQQLTLGI